MKPSGVEMEVSELEMEGFSTCPQAVSTHGDPSEHLRERSISIPEVPISGWEDFISSPERSISR